MKTPYALLTAALALLSAPAFAEVTFLGVASGHADATDAVVWTRAVDETAPAETPLQLLVAEDPGLASPAQTLTATTSAAKDYTAKLLVKDLKPGTVYYYRWSAGSVQSAVGRFKTAPAATAAVPVLFGFSGDVDGLMRPYPLAKEFPKLGLDFFAFVGDVIYENKSKGSPSVTLSGTIPAPTDKGAKQAELYNDYAKKYREQFLPVNAGGQAGLTDFFAAQGNYTLYDNHELGNRQYVNGGAPAGGPVGDMPTGAGVDARDPANDVNRGTTVMNQALGFKTLAQVYLDHQPVREDRLGGQLKLYSAHRWGKNVVFVNLDTRTFRDIRMKTEKNADETGVRAANPDRTYLGKDQLAWLKLTLLQAQAAGVKWKFVTTSDPIDQLGPLGGSLSGVDNGGNKDYQPVASDGGKAWIGGYRAERNDLLKFIADNKILNVVFLTTDDHQNRVNELTYSPSGQTEDQKTYVKVPASFEIVVGPLGATGPDLLTDHSFDTIKKIADTLAAAQTAAGLDPVGLDPKYPGLKNVVREGDPKADKNRSPIDFYSPDTFNLATLGVSADGKTLTVKTIGMNSTPADAQAEADPANPARTILSFQVDAR